MPITWRGGVAHRVLLGVGIALCIIGPYLLIEGTALQAEGIFSDNFDTGRDMIGYGLLLLIIGGILVLAGSVYFILKKVKKADDDYMREYHMRPVPPPVPPTLNIHGQEGPPHHPTRIGPPPTPPSPPV